MVSTITSLNELEIDKTHSILGRPQPLEKEASRPRLWKKNIQNFGFLTEHAYECAFIFVCAIRPKSAASKLAAKITVGFSHQMPQIIMDGTFLTASLSKVTCMICYMTTLCYFVYIVTPQRALKGIFSHCLRKRICCALFGCSYNIKFMHKCAIVKLDYIHNHIKNRWIWR